MKLLLLSLIFTFNSYALATDSQQLILNEDETRYLKEKKYITMCSTPNWMPFEEIHNGKLRGLSADYMKLISEKIKTPIILVPTVTWDESLQKAKNRECDILSISAKTPSRQKYMDFTHSYISILNVIATKTNTPFIERVENLKEKKIGIVKGYAIVDIYKKRYPWMKIVEVDSLEDGFNRVENSELYGYLDSSIVITDLIQKEYLGKININIQVNRENNICIATRNDEKILHTIFEKALLTIDNAQKQEIREKWLRVSYTDKIDYTLVIEIILMALVIILIFLYANLRLRKEIKKREELEVEKSSIFKKLHKITNDNIEFIEDLPIGIVSSDPNGVQETKCNKIFLQMFGWELEEIDTLEKWFNNAYPNEKYREEVITEWTQKVEESIQNNKPYSTPMEVLVTCKDGSTKWCQARYYEKKNFIHAGIFVDISEQKEAEKQLYVLNDSLEEKIEVEIEKNNKQHLMMMEQAKLSQMGEMIANIAHQWRQPLAQVNSSVLIIDTVLQKQQFQNELVESKLLEIEELTQYMSNTIENFQNFFNPNKEKTIFVLREVIDKSLILLQGVINANYTVIEVNVDKSYTIKGLFSEFQQVVVVLINNANDALILRKVKEPKITIDIQETAKSYILSISDNAGGIEALRLEQVFEPYYTTKHPSQGIGIGLYMAKIIIEQGMHGMLSVKNNPNGACFSIEINKEKNDR